MRSAGPRPPKRPRYTPGPAKTPARRYAASPPLRADQRCYDVAVTGPAGPSGRPLGTAARHPRPGRYATPEAASWR